VDRFLAVRSLPALFCAVEVIREGISDSYNARVFAESSSKELAYSQGVWRCWNGSIWVVDDAGRRRNLVPRIGDIYLSIADMLATLTSGLTASFAGSEKEMPKEVTRWCAPVQTAVKTLNEAGKKIRNLRGIESALTLAQSHLRVPDDAWNRDPYLLAVHNGVIDLRTSELLPASPEQRLKEFKSEILMTLRSSQMDPAGFYIALPDSLYQVLQAAPWVVLKLETTAPTRFSPPIVSHPPHRSAQKPG
jgi:hypothetical protein